MGTFFGPPIRVGIPIGISAGFGKPSTTNPHPGDDLLMETGDFLLQESGGTIQLE